MFWFKKKRKLQTMHETLVKMADMHAELVKRSISRMRLDLWSDVARQATLALIQSGGDPTTAAQRGAATADRLLEYFNTKWEQEGIISSEKE